VQDASPQLEDGYTRIANELFEAVLGYGFTQRQILVLLTVLRKTYGYGKKEDDMSAAQIGQICNTGRNHVTEVIGQLVALNVLTRAPGIFGLTLGINKNHKSWAKVVPKKDTLSRIGTTKDSVDPVVLPKELSSPKSGLVPDQDKDSPNLGQVGSPNLGHTKENLSKETQKKVRVARTEALFVDWVASCKAAGEDLVREDDPIFDYAEKQKLPMSFVRYAWLEFRRKSIEGGKKQKDWRAHFRNAVRENWYRLWFEKDDGFSLTTRGIQVQREHQDAA